MGFDDIIDFLSSLLIFGLESVLAAIIEVVQLIINGLQFIFQVDQVGFGYQQSVFSPLGSLWSLLRNTWLGTLLLDLWNYLSKYLKPAFLFLKQILCILAAFRAFSDYILNGALKPVINLIQSLRRILVIFRIFHFRFAQQADNFLNGLENDITRNFLQIRSQFNMLSNYINYILNPLGLFHIGLYLRSAAQSVGALIGLVHEFQDNPLDPATLQAQSTIAHSLDAQNVGNAISQAFQNGISQDDLDTIEAFNNAFNDFGYTG